MEQCFFDSGEIELAKCMYTPDVQLQPGVTYYWQVSVTDDAGDYADSEIATFEGGHPAEMWHGKWITAPFVSEIPPVFQKMFMLEKQELFDMRARMYVCGLGLYEVYLNGEKIGDEYLTPYYTDYRYWVQYQTYDVGSMLKCGENRIDVFLGHGWYMSRFGYLNQAQLRNYYGDEMKLLLERRNDHLCTGFVGTAHLCPALSRVGLTDKAYTLLLNEDYPSWLYEVNLGATTIWERWNSLLPDGSISDTGMNSLNHYAYGVIVEWIYRYVCGLHPIEEAPRFGKVRFAPQVDKRLSYAKATYDSMYGFYEAEFVSSKSITVNGTDVLEVSECGTHTFCCGSYEIEVKEYPVVIDSKQNEKT